jgi:hypothetical protein
VKLRWSNLRYGGGSFDLRKSYIKLCAALQKKPVLILDTEPQLATRLLASSRIKGSFLERLFAVPAWRPLYSIESEDGPLWEKLASECHSLFKGLAWQEKTPVLCAEKIAALAKNLAANPERRCDGEEISRLALRVLYEVVFEQEISPSDETLFYQASLEWRKEIAVKAPGNRGIKLRFVQRLQEIISTSKYGEGYIRFADNPAVFISVFAQPFIISPQINVSDIMAAVFFFVEKDAALAAQLKIRASAGDDHYLHAVIMEAMRLRHPFPILERELTKELNFAGTLYPVGTQVFILLDQFRQDPMFMPERWSDPESVALYGGLLFGAGQRVCLGKGLANVVLLHLLKGLVLCLPEAQLCPTEGHLFSGRDNDGSSGLRESLYQGKIFLRALYHSWKIGRQQGAKNGCPFSPSF